MKSLIIVGILFLFSLSAFNQKRKKDIITITLQIKDFENKPIHSAIATIKTIDKRQNSRYGSYSEKLNINNYQGNKDSLFTMALSRSRFGGRKVSIRVFDTRNLAIYYKSFYEEFEELNDGQLIDVKTEIDEVAYKNRTSKINFSGKIFTFLNPPFEKYFHDIYKSSFSGEIFTEDFDKKIMDTAIVSFSIDKNCNIINRKIEKKILGLRTDIETVIINALESRLKELSKTKYECKEAEITGLRILWGQH
jgi:hypothetical protein